MDTADRSQSRTGVYWLLFASMALSVLGAGVSLISGLDGDLRRAGLWIVIACGLAGMLVLIFAPRLLMQRGRDSE